MPRKRDPKARAPEYDWEWYQLVLRLIRLRGRVCEMLDHQGDRQLSILAACYGDHIVELRDGGARLDEANVQLACARCHGRKTHQERTRRLQAMALAAD